MLTVPLAILGALTAVILRGTSNDVYTQIGFVMLVGMASKNAILIVELANLLREQGKTIAQSALEACEERLRPILMTAIATVVGALPLMIASGPGAVARQSLGTAIVGGMCVATVLSLFLVPVLYVVIKSMEARYHDRRHPVLVDGNLDGHNGGQSVRSEPSKTAIGRSVDQDD
jgi:hydrophobic/amphiphilic exporter-1 (mainly G- bacteria), HAE1 family